MECKISNFGTFTAAIMLMIFTIANLPAQTTGAASDKAAIEAVIQSAYVDGLQNWGDSEVIRAGFHPEFELLTKTADNQIRKLPIEKWIEMVENRKARNPEGPGALVTADITSVDITVDAAVAKLDLFREGKKLFTDYLLLYKFDEGWRIVGKIYHRF
jgi:hypothetical protein